MIRTLAFLTLLVVAAPAVADDSAARMEAAERYISSPAQQEMLSAMFTPEAVLAQLRTDAGAMSPDQQNAAARIVSEELAEIRPLIENAMIKAAADTFTLAEIKAADAFYRTTEGASILGKMQPMMGNFWNRFGPILRQMQRKTATRLKQELR